MPTDPETDAERLLARVRSYIKDAYPSERIGEGKDPRTETRIFRIGSARRVEVTERFLDAEGGLTATTQRLDSWDLPGLLSALEPGETLFIRSDGAKVGPHAR